MQVGLPSSVVDDIISCEAPEEVQVDERGRDLSDAITVDDTEPETGDDDEENAMVE